MKQIRYFGFASGMIFAALNLWFFIAFVLYLPILNARWQGIANYAANFQTSAFMAWIIPCLFIGPVLMIMMSCLYFLAGRKKRFWGRLALLFSVPAATILSLNYYIQMTVVRNSLAVGESEGLSLWLYANTYPYTIPGAMEAVGYAFMCLSFLFGSQVLGKGNLQQWVRWMFIGIALTGSVVFIDPLFRIPTTLLLIDGLLGAFFLIIGPILLATLFLKRSR